MPEGAVMELVIDDECDALDGAERDALHGAIERSLEQARAGQGVPADAILGTLRSRRGG